MSGRPESTQRTTKSTYMPSRQRVGVVHAAPPSHEVIAGAKHGWMPRTAPPGARSEGSTTETVLPEYWGCTVTVPPSPDATNSPPRVVGGVGWWGLQLSVKTPESSGGPFGVATRVAVRAAYDTSNVAVLSLNVNVDKAPMLADAGAEYTMSSHDQTKPFAAGHDVRSGGFGSWSPKELFELARTTKCAFGDEAVARYLVANARASGTESRNRRVEPSEHLLNTVAIVLLLQAPTPAA